MATVEGGTHETGFKSGLTRVLNDYARKNGILKDSDKNLSGDDVREGLCAVISVKLENAQFESQTKAKLGNSEMRRLVDKIMSQKLAEFLQNHEKVAWVKFCGLKGDKYYDLAQKYMPNGSCGVISFSHSKRLIPSIEGPLIVRYPLSPRVRTRTVWPCPLQI